tara:strand:- start:202 stop:399 length:198 start_codon:yes stop_codon:yes gene_type:complete
MGLSKKHKDRNMKCWHCQTDLIWGSDKKIEDDHVMGNDEFSTVTDLSCPACNSYVEVYLPKELEI